MPALDPFSALSRPMLPFDSQPSNPLPFAATLQPIDQNSSLPLASKLPKPKRVHHFPVQYPVPAYSHSRHGSFDLGRLGSSLPAESERVGSDEWMKRRVNECVDTANVELDIKNLGLKELSTEIAGLQNLVTLPTSFSPRTSTSTQRSVTESHHSPVPRLPQRSPQPGHLPPSIRSFSRVSSAPASSAFFANHLNTDRAPPGPSNLGRTIEGTRETLLSSPALTSNSLQPGQRTFQRSKTNVAPSQAVTTALLSVYAANNLLTSLPTALFEISNLTLLSLRGNNLVKLPAAIGELRNLTDLNVSNNKITYIPSTILQLERLTSLAVYPNPFLRWTESEEEDRIPASTAKSGRLLGPISRRVKQSVPDLYTLCLQILISPRPPSNLPPLLDDYAWDPPVKGQRHPLHDPDVLHELIPAVPSNDLRRVLQALKSCSQAHNRHRDKRRGMAALGVGLRPEIFPQSTRPCPLDDASENPCYYPCPSPKHLEYSTDGDGDRPTRYLFIHPAEERIEWLKVLDQEVPIQWLGCSPGCLDYLEEEEEEEWGFSDEED